VALDQLDQTVVTKEPTAEGGQATVRTARRSTTFSPGNSEMARRITVLVFGLIQILIAARVLLLLLDAREGNGLVAGIIAVSGVFVAPFEGVLRTNALAAGGSILDVAAIVAFVGWSVLEAIVFWAVAIFNREPAVAAA